MPVVSAAGGSAASRGRSSEPMPANAATTVADHEDAAGAHDTAMSDSSPSRKRPRLESAAHESAHVLERSVSADRGLASTSASDTPLSTEPSPPIFSATTIDNTESPRRPQASSNDTKLSEPQRAAISSLATGSTAQAHHGSSEAELPQDGAADTDAAASSPAAPSSTGAANEAGVLNSAEIFNQSLNQVANAKPGDAATSVAAGVSIDGPASTPPRPTSRNQPNRMTLDLRPTANQTRDDSPDSLDSQATTSSDGEPGSPNSVADDRLTTSTEIWRDRSDTQEIPSRGTASPNNEALSPSPEIELVETDDDDMLAHEESVEIIAADEDDSAADIRAFLASFPFANEYGHLKAAQLMVPHFEKERPLAADLVYHLKEWLVNLEEIFKDRASCWSQLYMEQADFWDEFANIISRFTSRRHAYGDSWIPLSENPEEVASYLLENYCRLATTLVMVDAESLASASTAPGSNVRLLSIPHASVLCQIFQGAGVPLWEMLHQVYQVPVKDVMAEMGEVFVNRIIRRNAHGRPHIESLCQNLASRVVLNGEAASLITLLRLLQCAPQFIVQENVRVSEPQVALMSSSLLAVFDALKPLLLSLAEKQPSFVSVEELKDLLKFSASLLGQLTRLSRSKGTRLVADLVGGSVNESLLDTEDLAMLLQYAWKFRVLKLCIVKGRMETRVSCVEAMSENLVEIWRFYHEPKDRLGHPIVQYFATLLLDEKLVDYITGVDSHPQIIRRSGNISGFLVATRRYTTQQTDTIWDAITLGRNPEARLAMHHMLSTIVNLMGVDEIAYLCEKLRNLEIDAMTPEMRHLAQQLVNTILNSNSAKDPTAREPPVAFCIKLIQDALPLADRKPFYQGIVQDAVGLLRTLTRGTSLSFRRDFYKGCCAEITSGNERATGSALTLHCMLSAVTYEMEHESKDDEGDAQFISQSTNSLATLIEDTCRFIQKEKVGVASQSTPATCLGLDARLKLLLLLILQTKDAGPMESEEYLLDHLFGFGAISSRSRNDAWLQLAELVHKSAATHPFIDRCINEHIYKLDSDLFTPAFETCLKYIVEYQCRAVMETGRAVEHMPGEDLVWHVMFKVIDENMRRSISRWFSKLYFDGQVVKRFHLIDIEAAQIAVVQRCADELRGAHTTMSELRDITTADDMDADRKLAIAKRDFTRTLHFLQTLTGFAIEHSEFHIISPSLGSSVASTDRQITRGSVMQVSYQTFDQKASDIKSVEIGDEESLAELHSRLLRRSRFPRILTICGGQKIDLLSEETIKESGILGKGQILVKKVPENEVSSQNNLDRGKSLIEREMMNHFDTLYDFLTLDIDCSGPVFDVLQILAPPEKVRQAVSEEDVCSEVIFPAGKTFKSRYSTLCLQARLDDWKRATVPYESYAGFISHGINVLASAFVRDEVLESTDSQSAATLANIMLQCLLMFLKERSRDNSPSLDLPWVNPLIDRLTTILSLSMNEPATDSTMLSHAYRVLAEIIVQSSSAWNHFRSKEGLLDIHKALWLIDGRADLRGDIVQCVESAIVSGHTPSTAPSSDQLAQFYWQLIVDTIPQAGKYAAHTAYFYRLAITAFREVTDDVLDETKLRGLLHQWGSLLMSYEPAQFVGRDVLDEHLLGLTRLLTMCSRCLQSLKKPLNCGSLMIDTFDRFLFPSFADVDSTTTRLPVLDSQNRQELYDLVLILCEHMDNFQKLLEHVEICIDDAQTIRTLMYERSREIRAECGYVGLSNLSNTCYMNSLLAQLYMNIGFRNFVMSQQIDSEDDRRKLLFELQHLFASMQISFDKYASTEDFAKAIQTPDSNGIDVSVQMDVDEFFNLLFDQCESQIPKADLKQEFRSFYGGQTVNQIKSKECEHVSERDETFFAIQCVVKGKTNLQDSLDASVQGDVMEGDNKYKCESCGGRYVDAIKRVCLKNVPDNLIFHLKRFDFDLNTLQRSKINDYFEFPNEIDVSKYKVEYLDDPSQEPEKDIFELAGILVHSGTAESGHYYSYIRNTEWQRCSAPWVEFNDIDVDRFDEFKIPAHCYGGPVEIPEYEQFSSGVVHKSHNAYMLFYRRRTPPEKQSSASENSSNVPEKWVEDIARNNELRVREYCLFDPYQPAFLRGFIDRLVSILKGTPTDNRRTECRAAKVVVEYMYRIFAKSREAPDLKDMLGLRKIALATVECAKAALMSITTNRVALRNLMIRTHHAGIRTEVGSFIVDMLRMLREKDARLYGVDVNETERFSANSFEAQGALPLSCTRLVGLSSALHLNAKSWDDYFRVMVAIAKLGLHECAAMLRAGGLMEFFCVLRLPVSYSREAPSSDQMILVRMIDKRKPSHNGLIDFLWVLLKDCDLKGPLLGYDVEVEDRFDESEITLRPQCFPLTRRESDSLHEWDSKESALTILNRMIEMWLIPEPVSDLDNVDFTPGNLVGIFLDAAPGFDAYDQIASMMHTSIDNLNSPFLEPFILCVPKFCMSALYPKDARILIEAVVSTTELPDNHAGAEQLHCLMMLARSYNPRFTSCEVTQFYSYVLELIDVWAPALLTNRLSSVRKEVYDELRWLIFQHTPGSHAFRETDSATQSGSISSEKPDESDETAQAMDVTMESPRQDDERSQMSRSPPATKPKASLDWKPSALDRQRFQATFNLLRSCMLRVKQFSVAVGVPRKSMQPMFDTMSAASAILRVICDAVATAESRLDAQWTALESEIAEEEDEEKKAVLQADLLQKQKQPREDGILSLSPNFRACKTLLANYFDMMTEMKRWNNPDEEAAVSDWSEFQSDSEEILER